ncbi:MAG: T9SS type A sorting domain-containing protein [Bacteroidales bacterium]|nr:T9SS type A sorting domain-containing protein [Bacteroidales bacterium]
MKNKSYLHLLLLLFPFSVIAQEVNLEVVATSGSTFETANNQISWTLGEVVIETFSTGSFTLTQGFHQPGLLVALDYADPVLELSVKVYPVPFTSFVNLSFDEMLQEYSVELYNINGSRIHTEPVISPEIQLDLSALPAAEYILTITAADNKIIRSFKIVKH